MARRVIDSYSGGQPKLSQNGMSCLQPTVVENKTSLGNCLLCVTVRLERLKSRQHGTRRDCSYTWNADNASVVLLNQVALMEITFV